MVAVQFLLDGGGEAEELADDDCRQDKDGGGYGEGGGDEPEAGDLMDGWSWDGEQDSDVVDAVVGGDALQTPPQFCHTGFRQRRRVTPGTFGGQDR